MPEAGSGNRIVHFKNRCHHLPGHRRGARLHIARVLNRNGLRKGGIMPAKKEKITQEEATRQVLSIVNRMALLHYSFAKTLVRELGGKKGKEMARKAIDFYGKQVGKQVREKPRAKAWKPSWKIIRKTCLSSAGTWKKLLSAENLASESTLAIWLKHGTISELRPWVACTATWTKPSTRPTTRTSSACT